MKKLVLVIRAQESRPRMNATSANQSRGQKSGFAVQGDVLRNSIDTNKHYRNIGLGGVLKYLRRKLLPLH